MTLASKVEGTPLLGTGDAVLGTVSRLLFHPSEARVIGAVAKPPTLLAMVDRPEVYLPLSVLTFTPRATRCALRKLPGQRASADLLGYDPDTTVIWTNMGVSGPSGTTFGVVSDVEFDPETGALSGMDVAGGLVADAAHGRYVVPGEAVIGYRDGLVRLRLEETELKTAGGLAKTAVEGLAAASETARAIGVSVEDAVVGSSGAAGRAIRAVSQADLGRKAGKRVTRTWRDTVDAFKEGMKED